MKKKIVAIVDDDFGIIEEVSAYFTRQGYIAKGFSNADDLFAFLSKERCDLIILDLMLPGMSGFDICKSLKKKKKLALIPVIILSGRGEVTDKVSGLDVGADDYVVKPFSLKELDARVKAVLRRKYPGGEKKKINIGPNVVMDLERYEVRLNKEKVELTHVEFKILELFSTRKGQVFSREKILNYLWGDEKVVIDRTVDVHIKHLREKLSETGKLIKNVRGVGYKLEEG